MCTGKRMKLQRKAIHKSADEVAESLGCSRSTIFRYENGDIEKVPSSLIGRIADILETTPAYLMGWTDDPIDYDNLGDVWVPDEYKELGMGVKEYLAFKEAEKEDALKEQSIYAGTYTEHEQAVITAYRNQPEMQPAVDKILGVTPKLFNLAKVARRQEKLELTEEELKAILKSAKDAPNSSQDRNMF